MAQEATRLAVLGLKPKEIATRLDVDRSTVSRWMTSGKLQRSAPRPQPDTAVEAGEWAAAVRAAYALDATDEQLVRLAEAALNKARDPLQTPQVQLSAMGRFQAIVKQLALVTRNAEEVPAPMPEPAPRQIQPPRLRTFDPRAQLMAVK